MNYYDHKQETKEVKNALKMAGIPVVRVTHGRGTSYGWLEVKLVDNPSGIRHILHDYNVDSNCPACAKIKEIEKRAMQITLDVTGRTGDYDGRINIHYQARTDDEYKEYKEWSLLSEYNATIKNKVVEKPDGWKRCVNCGKKIEVGDEFMVDMSDSFHPLMFCEQCAPDTNQAIEPVSPGCSLL